MRKTITLAIVLIAGANDSIDYYCPAIEWEWGDDTKSESSEDCEPHQPGKSEIRRRYSTEHTYREEGQYTARFRMKQSSKVVASTSVNISVRAGVRDFGDQ